MAFITYSWVACVSGHAVFQHSFIVNFIGLQNDVLEAFMLHLDRNKI